MKSINITLVSVSVFFMFVTSLFANNDKIIINKPVSENANSAQINPAACEVQPINLPLLNGDLQKITPIYLRNTPKIDNTLLKDNYEVLQSLSNDVVLNPSEYTAFEINLLNSELNIINPEESLSETAIQALNIAPNWLYKQLKIKLLELHKANYDDDYAQLILDAGDNIKDEVAFCVANMSYQSLVAARFRADKEMIIRNAEHIYRINDSLKYVELVEYGSIENKDYYTTTKYKIYDSQTKDTVWSEIPKEHYYWYIVHPKLDQEGVYVIDQGTDASGQRTYDYWWRDFLWSNPDVEHNYMPVNITTTKGSVESIPRFGEIMQTAKFLWDRQEQYLPFGRELNSSSSALDIIGNWASRALPVDVTLPRAFQPNQIIMKHNGNCNEDAFLVAAACRTALIPLIYLSSNAEDHVYGAIWDEDWHHFEFFRGGLQVPGNDFFGITNMLPGGSYGWETSMVEGFRPDGSIINFTKYYAETSTFNVTVTDAQGQAVEGAMLQIFAPYGNGYAVCQRLYTDRKGEITFEAGAGKQYLANLYHPIYGWSPTDKSQAFYLKQGVTVQNATYNANLQYASLNIENELPTILDLPENTKYAFNLNLKAKEIITGISEHDNSQKGRFYDWKEENSGIVALFLCDEENYNKFVNDEPFTAYNYMQYVNGGELSWNLPAGNKWYVVLQNTASANILENVEANFELLSNGSQAVNDELFSNTIAIFPNPATNTINIQMPGKPVCKIYDMTGTFIMQFTGTQADVSTLTHGAYLIEIHTDSKLKRALFIKK
jgi:hypothetical protein